jgi:hypothetical protein
MFKSGFTIWAMLAITTRLGPDNSNSMTLDKIPTHSREGWMSVDDGNGNV